MAHFRQRLTASRLDQLAADLTAREQAVLAALATVHAATTDQLARLVAPHLPSADRVARRDLRRLAGFGLVRRFPDRSRDRKVGAGGHVHALSTGGLRLAGGTHTTGRHAPKPWRPSTAFLAHRLAITELYVRLKEREAAGGGHVRLFAAEPDCWRHFTGPAGQALVLRPDALVRLEIGETQRTEISWFVEVDLDTERRPATITAKCEAYRRAELGGHEQRQHGVFPGVVFIAPTAERVAALRRVIARQPPSAQALFVAVTEDEALDVMGELEVTS